RFSAEIERFARFLRRDQRVGRLIKAIHRGERIRFLERSEMLVHRAQNASTTLEAFVRDAIVHVQVAYREALVRRLATKRKRTVRSREIAASGKFVWHTRNTDIWRKIVSRTELVRNNSAHRRILNRGR